MAEETRLVRVRSEPATLSTELVAAIREALGGTEPVRILVDGEEDLATLPALLHTPLGGTVLYGMPGQGIVAVVVTEEARTRAERWLELMATAG